jgi:predicted RNA-binding Zn-ribbon protein involved in translation (DUF1610 family)
MNADQGTNNWTCKSCGAEFIPKPPNYSCPKCGSNITYPNSQKIRFEKVQLDEQKRYEAQRLAHVQQDTTQKKTVDLLCEHLMGMGIDARVVDLYGPESLKAPNPEGGITAWCMRIKGRHIDQIDINIDRSKKWCYSYQYRIAADVLGYEDELRCKWKNGQWNGMKVIPYKNWVLRALFGDKLVSNLLSEALNNDVDLLSKMMRLKLWWDVPYIHASWGAGCVWIEGFGGMVRLGFSDNNWTEIKPSEKVTQIRANPTWGYEDIWDFSARGIISVDYRRLFPTAEDFEVYDAVAEHIIGITKSGG